MRLFVVGCLSETYHRATARQTRPCMYLQRLSTKTELYTGSINTILQSNQNSIPFYLLIYSKMSQYSFPSHSDAHSHHHHYHIHTDPMSPSCHHQSHCPNANPNPTPNTRYESPIPFETALERLYTTLSDSVSFFKFLERSFEEETRFIRGYVSEGVLGSLWGEKVSLPVSLSGGGGNGSGSGSESSLHSPSRTHSHSHSRYRTNSHSWLRRERERDRGKRRRDAPPSEHLSHHPPSNNRTRPITSTLHDHLQNIDHALLDAIYCSWPSEPGPHSIYNSNSPNHHPRSSPSSTSTSLSCLDVDALSRLREKLWVQDQALRGITASQPGRVFREPKCLGEVVKECELLVFYLGRVRGLWR